jgi:hypothetical protein
VILRTLRCYNKKKNQKRDQGITMMKRNKKCHQTRLNRKDWKVTEVSRVSQKSLSQKSPSSNRKKKGGTEKKKNVFSTLTDTHR